MDDTLSPRQRYAAWVEERIEDHKGSLTRDELLELADEAVRDLFGTADEQYPITEILLRDAVDALIFRRLKLPSYRQWLRRNDTPTRPSEETTSSDGDTQAAS